MDFMALAFKSMWYLIRGTLVKAMVFPEVMYGCESWTVKKAERRRIDAFQSLGWEDPLEEGKATHSSIWAWRIPGTEEPGKL